MQQIVKRCNWEASNSDQMEFFKFSRHSDVADRMSG